MLADEMVADVELGSSLSHHLCWGAGQAEYWKEKMQILYIMNLTLSIMLFYQSHNTW